MSLARMKDYTYTVTNDGRVLTCHFRASLNQKGDGQTKFIKPNSQR